MSRLKVALFIPSLSGGGAERATATIAGGLDRNVFDPIILLERGGPERYRAGPEVVIQSLDVARSRATLPLLVGFLRRERPDVLYSALPHLNVLAALASRLVRPRPRLVVSVHSNQERELASVRNGRAMRSVMPLVYRSADAVVAVSDGIASELLPIVGARGKLRTIHNPLDVGQVDASAREVIEHPWLDGQHKVITAMGRLSPEKGFLSLVQAFARVHVQRPTARLLIIGEGEQAGELEKLAQDVGVADAVELLGFRQNPFAYLGRSACFVMSSLWEGFGMAIVEAMASGAAVLSTDCQYGPAEILEDGRYGLLARPGSIEDLAAGMLRLIDDDELREDLVRRGRTRAQDFDVSAVIPRYAALLLEVGCRGMSRTERET